MLWHPPPATPLCSFFPRRHRQRSWIRNNLLGTKVREHPSGLHFAKNGEEDGGRGAGHGKVRRRQGRTGGAREVRGLCHKTVCLLGVESSRRSACVCVFVFPYAVFFCRGMEGTTARNRAQ